MSALSSRVILAAVFIAAILPFLAVELLPSRLYLVMDITEFLLFHNLAELFSIIVSMSIFGVGWFTYDQSQDRHTLFLSTAFLAIGLMDLMHTLSYAGMPSFITPNLANKSTQYWLAARLFSAAAFLASAFVYPDRPGTWPSKYTLMAAAIVVATIVFTGITFFPAEMPVTFIEGGGLTPFKKLSEYLVIGLLILASAFYWRRLARTGNRMSEYFLAAFILCIFSELVFAVYKSVYDTFNLLGHLYKVAAFYLIYKGVFTSSVNDPYLQLSDKNEQLLTEVSERRQAEKALQLASSYSRNLIEASLDPLVTIGPDGKISDVNLATEKLTGFLRSQLIGTDFADYATEPDKAREGYEQAFTAGFVRDYPLEIRHRDGVTTHVLYNASVYRNEQGMISGVFAAARDISERKRAAEAIQAAAREWSASFDAMADGVSIHTVDYSVLVVNQSFLQLLGKSADEVVGRKCYQLMHDTACPIADCPVNITITTKLRADCEVFEPALDKWLAVSASPVLDNSGSLTRIVHTVRDITERKHAEESLRQSEQQFRDLLARLPDVVIIHHEGIIIYANQAAIDITEYPVTELVGSHVLDHVVPEERALVRRNMERRAAGDNVGDYEVQLVQKSGSLRNCIVRATKSLFNGNPAVFFILIDITDYKKLEEQLRQSQKMESIGTLAGGIAHDFNNILTAIIGYGNLALMKIPEDDPQRPNIQHMLEASDRAVHLTKDLLLFSRKQVMDRKPVDLNAVVATVEKFLRRVIGEDITFKTVLNETAIPLLADEHQLEQVLMNLATNARDAMPQGGLFTVTTEIVSLDGEFFSAHGYGKSGTYALLTASDTGMGMDEATRQRIFEPFFTTKEVGKGTGLGLAVAYGIIEQHDGHISVYSEPGTGTTFRIYLPVNAEREIEAGSTQPEEPVVGGTETILLAEDDESVRNLSERVLTEFGYSVIVAVDGADAVSKFKEHREAIDLLLLDLIMPKMNGNLVLEKIRKLRPGIRAIYSSGYAPDTIRQKMFLTSGVHLISKPISPMEMLRTVRDVLNEQ